MEYKVRIDHPSRTIESDWAWYNDEDPPETSLGRMLGAEYGYLRMQVKGVLTFIPLEYIRNGCVIYIEYRDDPVET